LRAAFPLRSSDGEEAPVPSINAISVVIPAYNARATIVETIDSARDAADDLQRIGVDVEIVVVDDGSTDGTRELVTHTFEDDQRIRVYAHRANRGGAAARNTAVERASNDWLYCVDSDNLLDPKSLRLVVEMAATGDWDVVAPSETRNFETSTEVSTHSWIWERDELTLADVLSTYETPVASGNYLYTLDIWARAGGYPEFAGSLDAWGFGVRALFEGARFGVCRDTFYLHRQGHDSYYVRDTDARRSVAAAQLLLPYLDRLQPSDRARLLGNGQLLRYFAELPQRPLEPLHDARRNVAPASHRLRDVAHNVWAEWSPRTTLWRLRKGRW
jgi:glycosyltransferase involved in cell wall biosynthesis